jgi:hypothetical protein
MTQISQMTDLAPSESASSAQSATRGRKRSGGTDPVVDDTVASYAAARAFLLGEWFGASLAVASFTLLYLFTFAARGIPVLVELGACLGLLAVGAVVYLRSRTYYQRVAFNYAPRWHNAAVVVAGSAGIFWLMLAFLIVLTYFGVDVLPAK